MNEIENEFNGLTSATVTNILRKSKFVDTVTFGAAGPLPSWIDLNPTELCNRKCVFCPRVDGDIYPNQPLHLSEETASKLNADLKAMGFRGVVALSGYGEPLLHPSILKIVKLIKDKDWRVELVTNGDRLDASFVKSLVDAGLDFFTVSMYDGPEQINYFESIFKDALISSDFYILRDRWYDEKLNYGVKLTNRTGNNLSGMQNAVNTSKPCFYPSYSLSIDWNGDVLLCVQDWDKKIKFGNISTEKLLSIWYSKSFSKIRNNLIDGNRTNSPCSKCNASGIVHGMNHSRNWVEN